MRKFRDFWGGVKTELMRVTWPSTGETIRMSLAVFGFVAFVAIILGPADVLFNWARRIIIER